MGKVDKKRAKLVARITYLQESMTNSLKQKTSSTAEISISQYLSEIDKLQKELAAIK